MTAAPGRLAHIFEIDLPRPRTIEMTFEPEFIGLIQEIKRTVETGGRRTGRGGGLTLSQVPNELRDEIPSFDEAPAHRDHGPIDWTGMTSIRGARSAFEIGTIVALAVGVFWGIEGILRWANTPSYVFPKPTQIVSALTTDFEIRYGHHLWVTAQEFLMGFAIGSTIGLVLAAVITQLPFVEKIVAPYIIILVTTPMLALVPFLPSACPAGWAVSGSGRSCSPSHSPRARWS